MQKPITDRMRRHMHSRTDRIISAAGKKVNVNKVNYIIYQSILSSFPWAAGFVVEGGAVVVVVVVLLLGLHVGSGLAVVVVVVVPFGVKVLGGFADSFNLH
jgi:hypothetical protein